MNRNRKKKAEAGVTVLAASLVLMTGAVKSVAQNKSGTEAQKVAEIEMQTETEKISGAGSSGQEGKSETVYAITDAAGNTREIIVEDWLKNTGEQAVLQDRSELSDIENTDGEESFTRDGETVVWEADGNDIHYQGKSEKDLPVSVHITYYLNGKEVSPEALAGKSGEIKIRYDYTNQEKREVGKAGQKESVYVPFTVMSGMIFTDNCVKNVSVSSGKVITKDDKTIVVGIAFPGLKQSLEIETDSEVDFDMDIPDSVEVTLEAENFELQMGATLIMSDLFDDLDLEDREECIELQDAIRELSDGVQELVDGSGELADGAEELYDRLPELTDGVQSLKNGIVEYTDGVSSIKSGTEKLKNGSGQLVSGAQNLSSGADALAEGAGELEEGSASLTQGVGTLQNGADGLQQGSGAITDSFEELVKGIEQISRGLQQLQVSLDGEEENQIPGQAPGT